MDVNILTKKEKLLLKCLIAITSLIMAFYVISCGGKPEEGEIVIWANDIVPADSHAEKDTLSLIPLTVDTTVIDTPESFLIGCRRQFPIYKECCRRVMFVTVNAKNYCHSSPAWLIKCSLVK